MTRGWSKAWRHLAPTNRRRNAAKDKAAWHRKSRRAWRQTGTETAPATERDVT